MSKIDLKYFDLQYCKICRKTTKHAKNGVEFTCCQCSVVQRHAQVLQVTDPSLFMTTRTSP